MPDAETTLSVTYVSAFLAGIVSFASPCVLPIVPAFLTIITGLDITDSDARRGQQGRIMLHTGLFILGFSVVFILLGLGATSLGSVLLRNQSTITRLSGVVVLAMAFYLGFSLIAKSPWLYQEKRFHPRLSRYGPFAAPVAGVAFGFGWTPCIGPVLTSVLAIAATRDRVIEGAILLGVYSLGLGVPFLITGLAFGRLAGAFNWVKRNLRAITFASAVSLAFFGTLLLFDRLTWVTSQLQNGLNAIGLEELVLLG